MVPVRVFAVLKSSQPHSQLSPRDLFPPVTVFFQSPLPLFQPNLAIAMPRISQRLAGFTESVIRAMTRLCLQYNAINLSQGFPDCEPPPELVSALVSAANNGPHQYEITWGSTAFRAKLAAKQSALMGLPIDPDTNIVVTCGSTEAMMTAILTVCDPGDKVIIFSPFYENYGADTILTGAEPIFVSLKPPTFEFDVGELEAAFASGAKALVLCNPSNPSGKVFRKDELEVIAALSIKYDAFVLTDEVYEHFVYPPNKHVYIASLPGMWERTLSCSSLSKVYSITGWRLGYVIAPAEIIAGARKVHDFLTVGAPAPLQKAALAGLEFDDRYYAWLLGEYDRPRPLWVGGLREIGLKCVDPQGAYYVMVDISGINKFATDNEFCEWLVKEIGVGAVPGSSFFKEKVNDYIRFHFAKRDEVLIEAIERLKKLKELL
jgi:aminotransferase